LKPKIIFWITGPDLHFSIAYKLQKLFDAELYAIYDIPYRNNDFFQKQKFVKFQKTWNYFENIKNDSTYDLDYLSNFEKKFNVNLWKLVSNERYFIFNDFHHFSRSDILSILTQECKLFEKILTEIKPNFFLTFDTPFHFSRLFFEMCRNEGIKVLMFQSARLANRCMISEDPHKLTDLHFETDSISELNSFEKLQNYLNSNDYSKQIKEDLLEFSPKKSSTFFALLDYFYSDNKISQTHYSYYGRNKISVLLNKIKIELKTKYRKRFIDKNFLTKIEDSKFVLFPLPMAIEQNPLITAPFYTNQIELIRSVVKSLPIDYKLYVKEHPAQYTRGWRSISDYNEILNMLNVKLIHPDFQTKNIYEKCSLVISSASTASFEAAFYGKPSIIFSDLMFDSLPSVFRVKSIEELPNIIRTCLETTPNLNDVVAFIKKLESASFEFNLFNFFTKISKYFYYDGNNTNVKITNDQMEKFLSDNNDLLEQTTLEHIKRINMYDNSQ